MRKSLLALAAFAILCVAHPAYAQDDKPFLLRQPALSRTEICFVYGSDLWKVPREGGDAIRLTAGPGIKRGPHFSPDGQWIAFTGEYDGRVDVYVIPASGGTPRRVTYYGGPQANGFSPTAENGVFTAMGWTPDGQRILFSSPRNAFAFGVQHLYTVPLAGGFPTELPLPLAYEGSFSPDATHIAYRPLPLPWGTWDHYRGGTASKLWIANLADSTVVPIPREDWNDRNPIWIGDTIYYLSDQNGAFTLFAYDTKSQQTSQLIENHGMPFKWASAGPGAIVYEQFGSLHLYDLASRTEHPVTVHVSADLVEVRPHFEKMAKHIDNAVISPTGVRAAFETHGGILTVPAEKGDFRNITKSPGVADRDPGWSPDGKSIAYFSDESGEYALHIRDQNGLGEVHKISLGNPPSFFYSPHWSPDSKKISYYDKRYTLWYVDLDKATPVKIDTTISGRDFDPAWSPDSRWLAYSKTLPNLMHAEFVYSLDDAKSTQVTDGMSDARYPIFDKSGKYIFFTASTNIGPTVAGLDMSGDGRTVTRHVYVVVLRKDLPSPLAPESDDEKADAGKSEKKDDADKGDASKDEKDKAGKSKDKGKSQNKAADKDTDKEKDKDKDKDKEAAKTTIDFDNISQRTLALPVPAKTYIGAFAGKAGELILLDFPDAAELNPQGPPAFVVSKFDLEKRKVEPVIAGIQNLDVSFNGEKILYQMGDDWFIAPVSGAKPGEGKLKLDEMEVWVEPRKDWKQMFDEVWRIERDFFYDPHTHGANLKALEKEYGAYLDGISTRDDLNYLFSQMLGELNVGHMFVGGGDNPEITRTAIGLLGADYSIDNGRYRFQRVFNGENWNPRLRAPLTQPGVNVVAGEYLLAVNGRDLVSSDDIFSFFQETADKQTVLKVGPNPDGSGSREVTVIPVDDEEPLRNRAWIENNRRKVDELSNGRLAYVYIPDTAAGGFTYFNRYYFAQIDKKGAVMDERFNTGGQAADYIIQYMQRKIWNYWTSRDDDTTYKTPAMGIYGPKAMITNEFSGSGGDALPWYFHHTGLGPLVGKRTWGGLVGIGGFPGLIDGGFVTAPNFAFFTTDSHWEVENHGVPPDFDIELDPHAWREGHDAQLEKAVQLALADLEKNPPPVPHRPPYSDYGKYSTAH